MIENAPWQEQFWGHYDNMSYNGHYENDILKNIQEEFLKFENFKSFTCHDTAILYQLFLNAIFEENKMVANTAIDILKNDNGNSFVVHCDELTDEIRTAMIIIW